MRRIAIVLFVVLGGMTPLLAQTPLDKLEQRVQEALDPRNDPKTTSSPPGYLGLVIDDRGERGVGVRILELTPDGPAQKSGLQVGDLINTVGDTPVLTKREFARVIESTPPGTKLQFTLVRGALPQHVEVTIGQRPVESIRVPRRPPADSHPGLLGVRVDGVSAEMQQQLGLPSARGALVVGVADNSPAERAGIPPDAVIVAVDSNRVDTPADLIRRVTEAGPGKTINVAFFDHGSLVERRVALAGPPPGVGPSPPMPNTTPMQTVARPPSDPSSQEQTERIRMLETRVQELERRLGEMQRLLQAGNPPPAAPAPGASTEEPKAEAVSAPEPAESD